MSRNTRRSHRGLVTTGSAAPWASHPAARDAILILCPPLWPVRKQRRFLACWCQHSAHHDAVGSSRRIRAPHIHHDASLVIRTQNVAKGLSPNVETVRKPPLSPLDTEEIEDAMRAGVLTRHERRPGRDCGIRDRTQSSSPGAIPGQKVYVRQPSLFDHRVNDVKGGAVQADDDNLPVHSSPVPKSADYAQEVTLRPVLQL